MNKKEKITQRAIVAARPEERRYAISDTEIPGFRVYIYPTGRKSFCLRYRANGGRSGVQREPKIGEFPAMKADAARRIAIDWLHQVRLGGDPSSDRLEKRAAPTMSDLFDRYMRDHAIKHKKPRSVEQDEILIRLHLMPTLGHRKVADVTRNDVSRLHSKLGQKPYRANRALALLSKAFNLAEEWGMRPDFSNPCRHVKKFKEHARKRFLSPDEFRRLGEALVLAEEGEIPRCSRSAVAAIRLLALTGARRGEILELRWDWVDFERQVLVLPDSKTGAKQIFLPDAAIRILGSLERVPNNPHVITGGKPGTHLINLKDPWKRIRAVAQLDDVRIHDLRHSFAAMGVGGGASLPIIGGLLGHSEPQTTQRYAHLSDHPLARAADSIGDRIAKAIGLSEPSVSRGAE